MGSFTLEDETCGTVCGPVRMHDGFGVWCAARRLNAGSFVWPRQGDAGGLTLTREQFDALVLGLPWQRLEQLKLITRV